MTEREQKNAAKNFSDYWKDKGYEKGESQAFWLSLLREVLGVEKPETIIRFEDKVMLDHTSFIDGIIESTHVLIEQKSADKDLRKAIRQSDGSYLTPFQQAKRYSAELPYSERPRWIVTCNFREFLIYDMEKPTGEPESILLKDLSKEAYRLQFLVDTGSEHVRKEMEISIKAGELVGILYDEILKQYNDPEADNTLKSLNKLCVRIVFCLYAEDSGLFGNRTKFHDYIKCYAERDIRSVRKALIELFKVLDMPEVKRKEYDPYMDEELASFPYVNGGLFADENIEIPNLNENIVSLLLRKASENFDWSEISPTIFGAVFESTLNPETRRSGGMHYTSIENIHKVIDPLFLDDLRAELDSIKSIKTEKTREQKLIEFQNKLASLTFLDPACGSGNFLTETYLSLRRLENEMLRLRLGKQMIMGAVDPIRVSIGQFYGIEINDFAVTVAKTALWIAESQMMKQTEEIVNMNLDFLPLKSYANIVEANALLLDWESVVPKDKLNYIMGNPPFVGAMWSKGSQREDIATVFPECAKPGQIDYVAGWYAKASKLIVNTNIRCAFVSTNSICQGQQVGLIWKPLIEIFQIKFDFAYHTFRWDSEASIKAHVHCIIIGFSHKNVATEKRIYSAGRSSIVGHINGYLAPAADMFIEGNRDQISGMPPMHMGVMARDGGHLIMNEQEYQEYIAKEPQGIELIHPYMMGREFINNIPRYCFWLLGANPAIIKKCPLLMKRIEGVRQARLESPAIETQKLAETPSLFAQLNQPKGNFLAFPKVSSEKRKYIPIGFLSENVIVGDKLYVVENVGLYHFGILTSNVHNAWMRLVAGRMKSDYSYSNTIVYNSFPWPTPTEEQKTKIEQTAQEILDARALYPDSSLADLYDELTMPVELRRAHQHNDKAVMQAYGFWGKLNSESECVAELMKMYQELAKEK